MASRTEKLEKLRRHTSPGIERKSPSLVGGPLTEAGRLDQAVLNQEVEAIFQEAAGIFPARDMIEDQLKTLVGAGRRGEVQKAAEQVIALLRLDLDDLRKAALLSLMVRLTGKRKFDPVAAYVLEKRTTYVTGQG